MNKKGYDTLSRSFVFLRTSMLSFKMKSQPLQAVRAVPTQS